MRLLQRRAMQKPQAPIAPPIVHRVLQSPGRPLGGTAGADFSHVRVHTDVEAAGSAKAVGAAAYTVGRHVVFGAGRFSPLSPSGRDLLRHELMHVEQQRSASETGVLRIGDAGSPLEREADRKAETRLVQRQGAVTPPPASLSAYPEAERKALVSINSKLAAIGTSDINALFAPPVPGAVKTSYSLASSIHIVFDPAIAAKDQAPLTATAAYLTGHITPPLDVNQTMSIEITALKAVMRFSYIQHGKDEVMLVERLGAIPAAGSATALAAGTAKFKAKSLTFAASFTDAAEKNQVYEALAAIPDAALSSGVEFSRKATGTSGEAGSYDPAATPPTIWLFDSAFATSSTRSGLATEITRVIAHEAAHAADRQSLQSAFASYQGSSGKAADEKKLTSARGLSGLRMVKSGKDFVDSDAVFDVTGDFRAAATKDGVAPDSSKTARTTSVGARATLKGSPTSYGDTSWEELFAESFSLYVTDPNLLKAIRPNIYAYFLPKYPQTAAAPATPTPATGGSTKP